MKKPISLINLFWTFFKINMITFGGGFVIMPIIRKDFVEKKKILDEQDMLDMIALAQSIPGAMAINTSMLVGHRLRGLKGAIISMIGASLPPLLVISIISFFYGAFQTNPYILALLRGMRGAVTAVMIVAAYSMMRGVLKKDKAFAIVMMIGSFLIAYFTNISVGYLMLVAALIGYLYFTFLNKKVTV
jgi:chromate transporter